MSFFFDLLAEMKWEGKLKEGVFSSYRIEGFNFFPVLFFGGFVRLRGVFKRGKRKNERFIYG